MYGVVELAAASGLSRVAADERDALAASTFGTGQVIAAAIGLGVRNLVVGLGGSATTDGGSGLLTALGARFLDRHGHELPGGGGSLGALASVDLSDLAAVLGEVHLSVASDVTNPLLGERGAAATYGPQKGADEAQVAKLETNLAHYADLLEATAGRSIRNEPGAGAAGGTTAGLLAIADRFASFVIRPGVDVVMELTGFEAALAASDLVLTGEGRIDEQTGFGKTAAGVARRARDQGIACICFGGGVLPGGFEALAALDAIVVPVVEQPLTVEQAMAAGRAPIFRAAERAARLVSLGASSTPAKRKVDPVKAWLGRLRRYRPDLMPDTLAALASMYGRPTWQRVYDPTSELVLTMLSANSADINAEKAFDALCRRWPGSAATAVPAIVPAGAASASPRAEPTGRRSPTRRSTSSSTSSAPVGWGRRRHPASRLCCATSSRNAATTRSSSSAR